MKSILLFILLFISLTAYSHTKKTPLFDKSLQEGDLIFHRSQSSQSLAIAEATGSTWSHVGIIVKRNSNWYVFEARQGVEINSLTSFIDRGRNKEFKIFRFKAFDTAEEKRNLYSVLNKYFRKPYDIYFEFSEERIYCSELTYKVMLELTGQEVGIVNKMKDLRLDGPYVKELIKRRLTDLGKEVNPEEPIVTPISQMIDTNLELVMSSRR